MTEGTNVTVLAPPAELKAMPVAEIGPYDFMPKTLTEAMELARMLSESTMVPRDYIGKAGNVFVAMQHGAELGLKPVQALQSMAVINGKPGIYGDAGKALLIRHGCQIEEFDLRKVEEMGYAQCTISRPGHKPKTQTFSIEDAKRARLWGKEGPWTLYPFRQMSWRAFWFAARDAAPDILKGLPPAEELRDMEVDVTPQGETVAIAAPAKEPSATEKLKQKVATKGTELVNEFNDATTATQVVEIAGRAKAAALTGSDRVRVGAAYKEALARMTPAVKDDEKTDSASVATGPVGMDTDTSHEGKPPGVAGPAGPAPLTDQQIVDKLNAAKERADADQVCADHINPLPDGPRKKGLLAMYNKRAEDLS